MSTICRERTYCFAKKEVYHGMYVCGILTEVFTDRPCPFKKADRSVTNGKRYPYINPANGKSK